MRRRRLRLRSDAPTCHPARRPTLALPRPRTPGPAPPAAQVLSSGRSVVYSGIATLSEERASALPVDCRDTCP